MNALQHATEGRFVKGRGGREFREAVGYSAQLTDVTYNWLCNGRRKACPKYANAELLWYLSRRNTIELLKAYAPKYKQFVEENGKAHGAYGYRIGYNTSHGDQLQMARMALEAHEGSRQVVIALWHPDDLVHAVNLDKKDLPCTLTWQFILRDQLHMVVNMRSNDVWLGLPYDLFVFTSVQRLLAASLGVVPGTYTHNVASMHMYCDDNNKCFEASLDSMQRTARQNNDLVTLVDKIDFDEQTAEALHFEQMFREHTAYHVAEELKKLSTLHPILSNAVACCATKFGIHSLRIRSEALDHAHH